jgi:signal transduction histidine kinase
MTLPASGDQVVYTFAPIGEDGLGVVLEEPWPVLFSSAVYYEAILAGLIALGIVLSLIMLSISVGRVVKPLTNLARRADALGPGSLFRPVQAEGPEEVYALTQAFNQMVIRLAEQQATLRQYAEKALLSQEEERQRISHELHDETVQELVGLLQRVDLCRTELDKDPGLARRRLDELKTLAETALGDLRRISNALRPSILQDLGLSVALHSLCDELERQMPDVICTFIQDGPVRRLSAELELAIYRVVQEALTNIRRHAAKVSQVSVRLDSSSDDVRVIIQDDGSGFKPLQVGELVRDGHLGLAGMYERARLFGGELNIQSYPDSGTTITLCLPLNMGMVL